MPVPGSKPWHFAAVYPVQEGFDLGKQVLSDKKVNFGTGADLAGVLGCTFTKLDEPEAFGAGLDAADPFAECPCGDPREASDEDLQAALESVGGMKTAAAVGALPPWVAMALLELARRGLDELIKRLFRKGGE